MNRVTPSRHAAVYRFSSGKVRVAPNQPMAPTRGMRVKSQGVEPAACARGKQGCRGQELPQISGNEGRKEQEGAGDLDPPRPHGPGPVVDPPGGIARETVSGIQKRMAAPRQCRVVVAKASRPERIKSAKKRTAVSSARRRAQASCSAPTTGRGMRSASRRRGRTRRRS